jgi:integrase
MKQPTSWPHRYEDKANHFSVKIYRREFSKTKGGKTYDYEEFKFAYRENKVRKFRTAPTWGGIIDAVGKVIEQIRAEQGDAVILKGEPKVVYTRALDALRGCNVPLDIAALEYADARALLGTVSLKEAAKFYASRHSTDCTKTVREVFNELLDKLDKRQKPISADYRKDLNSRLIPFADAFHVPIASVKAEQIDQYLSGFKGRTRFNHARLICSLFKFAQSKKYFPRDVDPFEGIEMDYADDGEIEIFTPEEISKLLSVARPELVPFIAIGAFAGLRSAEIARLDWSEISETHIKVTAGKAKTRSRRLIPIQDNLRAWLETYRKESGPVLTLASMGKQIEALADDAAIKWKRNGLRHSFVTYRIAVTNDENMVSVEAGNSPTMIHGNYRQLATAEQGKAWFSIAPELPENVILGLATERG